VGVTTNTEKLLINKVCCCTGPRDIAAASPTTQFFFLKRRVCIYIYKEARFLISTRSSRGFGGWTVCEAGRK